MTNIVWLRRNLRLDDNRPLFEALAYKEPIQVVFILDTDILARFHNPTDRRVAFIKNALALIDSQLMELGGELIVAKGRPQELIPRIAKNLGATRVFADEDYEPSSIKRDKEVSQNLENIAELKLYCDHLIFHPQTITKLDGKPFLVYTPYMKAFRANLSPSSFLKYNSLELCNGLIAKTSTNSYYEPKDDYSSKDPIWNASSAHSILEGFVKQKLTRYKEARDYLASDGTSQISPYLRFGLISIRELFRASYDKDNSFNWVNELIWREFYASILYHFPHSATSEFNLKYSSIPWNRDKNTLSKITNAETGYPIIDAAIIQLLTTGWMHNRARMIVASFWTKNLLLDWRLGDEFFAQHLMDYDLASNIGGWQWSASCGTDAQPYFRIFNPMLQGQKFDPDGTYVKTYIPALQQVLSTDIHDIKKLVQCYIEPMVDYSSSRTNAINTFRTL